MSAFRTTHEQEKEGSKIPITFKTSEIIPTSSHTPKTFAFHCALRKPLASQNDDYCASTNTTTIFLHFAGCKLTITFSEDKNLSFSCMLF